MNGAKVITKRINISPEFVKKFMNKIPINLGEPGKYFCEAVIAAKTI